MLYCYYNENRLEMRDYDKLLRYGILRHIIESSHQNIVDVRKRKYDGIIYIITVTKHASLKLASTCKPKLKYRMLTTRRQNRDW